MKPNTPSPSRTSSRLLMPVVELGGCQLVSTATADIARAGKRRSHALFVCNDDNDDDGESRGVEIMLVYDHNRLGSA